MKLANNIHLRVFVLPEDDYEEMKSSLLDVAGFKEEELKKEKVKLSETKAKGFNDKTIRILEIILEKDRHCNSFLKRLGELLSPADKKKLREQDNRLDENMKFYIRLEKQGVLNGDFALTDSGECFHITLSVSAFPRKRSVALSIIKEIFQ